MKNIFKVICFVLMVVTITTGKICAAEEAKKIIPNSPQQETPSFFNYMTRICDYATDKTYEKSLSPEECKQIEDIISKIGDTNTTCCTENPTIIHRLHCAFVDAQKKNVTLSNHEHNFIRSILVKLENKAKEIKEQALNNILDEGLAELNERTFRTSKAKDIDQDASLIEIIRLFENDEISNVTTTCAQLPVAHVSQLGLSCNQLDPQTWNVVAQFLINDLAQRSELDLINTILQVKTNDLEGLRNILTEIQENITIEKSTTDTKKESDVPRPTSESLVLQNQKNIKFFKGISYEECYKNFMSDKGFSNPTYRQKIDNVIDFDQEGEIAIQTPESKKLSNGNFEKKPLDRFRCTTTYTFITEKTPLYRFLSSTSTIATFWAITGAMVALSIYLRYKYNIKPHKLTLPTTNTAVQSMVQAPNYTPLLSR
ncbi:MAG: hypothetical protein JW725_04140 [Candidatus Babeliaceae bacterium]|nr:hypothetical protein [Candidatus Babeliaceae bacterium]